MASLAPFTGTLGVGRAAHLLRRATFRQTRATIDSFAQKTAAEAAEALFTVPPPTVTEPRDPLTGQAWINSGVPPQSSTAALFLYVRAWRVNQALLDPSIGSKMLFFLHSNFVVTSNTLTAANFYDYLALLQYYCVGNFRKLAEKMTVDNVMLAFLDNTLNSVGSPNENYAREFLELFTIGKGPEIAQDNYTNYTEQDVQQGARVLTGFRTGDRATYIDPETNIPRGRPLITKHDKNPKTFSSAFQNLTINGGADDAGMWTELTQYVDMVFAQAETARFICRKMYRYFVGRNITDEIEADIIEPMAQTFRNSGYELKPVLTQLLTSKHFFDEEDGVAGDQTLGAMMKSPLELLLGALSYFDVKLPDPETDIDNHYRVVWGSSFLSVILSSASMDVFRPADVAGYPAYYQTPDYHRAWFHASSIISRYKLPEMLLTGKRIVAAGNIGGGVKLDFAAWVKNSGGISNPFSAETLVTELLTYLFPQTLSPERLNYFLNDVFLNGQTADDWSYEWQNYVDSGVATEVSIPLGDLLKAVMYAPEYQLQ